MKRDLNMRFGGFDREAAARLRGAYLEARRRDVGTFAFDGLVLTTDGAEMFLTRLARAGLADPLPHEGESAAIEAAYREAEFED